MPSTTDTTAAVTSRECRLPDGRRLAYASAGDPDGTPVVVHHGTPGSRLFAALFADEARDVGVRLVVPDRPGYGRSTPPPAGWTWTDWPDDLAALLRAESTESAAVVGFSGGGPYALAAASADLVSRVGLLSAFVPAADAAFGRVARVPFVLGALFRISGLLARVVGPSVVVGQYTQRSVSDAVAAAVGADFAEALRQGVQAPVRELREFAAVDGSSDAVSAARSVPVHAWHGTADTNAPLSPLRCTVRKLGGTVETVDADHLGTVLDCRREALRWVADA
jgi:pimeloyl-ACP methyl ester carboxylesterase